MELKLFWAGSAWNSTFEALDTKLTDRYLILYISYYVLGVHVVVFLI